MTKPFSIRELMARANVFLRRRRQGEPRAYRLGDCELDVESHRLTRDGARYISFQGARSIAACMSRRNSS